MEKNRDNYMYGIYGWEIKGDSGFKVGIKCVGDTLFENEGEYGIVAIEFTSLDIDSANKIFSKQFFADTLDAVGIGRAKNSRGEECIYEVKIRKAKVEDYRLSCRNAYEWNGRIVLETLEDIEIVRISGNVF